MNATTSLAGLLASLLLIAAQSRALGQDDKLPAKGARLAELAQERLATVREMAKLAQAAYEQGNGSYDLVRAAHRLMLDAELEHAATEPERLRLLEQFVAQAKAQEEIVARQVQAGRMTQVTALRAKAERLQAEIALERARAKAAPPAPPGAAAKEVALREQAAQAEKQVAIKEAAVKVADAHRAIAEAKLRTLKAQIEQAQVTAQAAKNDHRRLAQLAAAKAVSAEDLSRSESALQAALAQVREAESKLIVGEAELTLEQARRELARAELEETLLRLEQLRQRARK